MINQLIQEEFGFQQVEIEKLVGYENENYLVRTKDGKYVFKTYPERNETLELVEAENNILLALQKTGNQTFPIPVSFSDGTFVKRINVSGEDKICRMLTFLEGDFLGEVEHSEKLFQSLGTYLARMDLEHKIGFGSAFVVVDDPVSDLRVGEL